MTRILPFLLLALLSLAACDIVPWRESAAVEEKVALPQTFIQRPIHTDPFTVMAFERVRNEGQVANIYIEGDGVVWTGTGSQVALTLAVKDVSPNVVYLGRPCQFLKQKEEACVEKYWKGARFSPEIVNAMSLALDDIKKRYRVYGFNIVGYAGGAVIGAKLAAVRQDVLSLRTVEGQLSMAGDVAAKILPVSQKHFVTVKSSAAASGFIEKSGRPDCVSATVIDLGGKNWGEQWQSLLEQPLEGGCQ